MTPIRTKKISDTAQKPTRYLAKDIVTKLTTDVLRKSKGPAVSNTDAVLVFYQGSLLNGAESMPTSTSPASRPLKAATPSPPPLEPVR